MRNMTPEERKQMYAEIMKKLDEDFLDTLKNGNWGPSPITNATPTFSPTGLSPTDIDAKGKYSYQEPEVDEQGTYYGYKILIKNPSANSGCGCEMCLTLCSPRYFAEWINGELQADFEPSEKEMHGIHFTKHPNHPELQYYTGRHHGSIRSYGGYTPSSCEHSFLVKCALSGTIVETEQGFRAEHAQIIGVYADGNWQSYQDYQERTRAYTRPTPIYEDEENGEWRVNYRLTYGKPPKGSWSWDTSTDTNP